MKSHLLAASTVATLLLTACGGEPSLRPGSSKQAIIGGQVTYQYPEFGSLQLGGENCSGTLIGPRTVLTAAHCVGFKNQGSSHYVGQFTVYEPDGRQYNYSVIRFMSRTTAPLIGQYDIAVLQLSQAVPSNVATPHLIGASYPAAGRKMTIFGFGGTAEGSVAGAGFKRRRDFIWEVTGERGFDYVFEVIAPGDSGGALVADRYIIGVVSGYGVDSPYQDYFGNVVQEHAWVGAWRNYFETYH